MLKRSAIWLLPFLCLWVFAQEESVKPGINDSWKSEEIDPLINRLESESREIYVERHKLVELLDIKPGSTVADIGAGSGFMALLFAEAVGPEGKVYAVDINPTMMESVAKQAAEEGLKQLETVVCPETSVGLPDASVDLMFICDTYHHFEYPNTVNASIYKAIKPGGQLIIVDFIRIEGVSEEWIMNHVRAGKEVFSREIEAAGFKLVKEHDAPFLQENYVLRFDRIEKK